ncbi:hypothetical protein F442_05920, partial [Phytophthora nicotianae P10297]
VEGQYEKQNEREKKTPGLTKSSRAVIKASLLQSPPITARELCVFVGLLIARAILPNKEKIENHWKTIMYHTGLKCIAASGNPVVQRSKKTPSLGQPRFYGVPACLT